MKRLFLLMAILFLILVSGCRTTNGPKPEEDHWFEIAEKGEDPAA